MTAAGTYTVQTGDTLSGIAQQQLGSAALWPELYQDNQAVIGSDPNVIYTGEQLILPASTIAVTEDDSDGYVPKHAAPSPDPSPSSVPSQAVPSMSVSVTAPGFPVLVALAKYLEGQGATRTAAAGIAGCVEGESAGDPESVGSGGFGLIGWTGNTIGLPAGYTGPTGNFSQDLAAQEQGTAGYINALGGFSPINAADSVLGAAQVFSAQYERPAVQYSDVRFAVAEQVYAAL